MSASSRTMCLAASCLLPLVACAHPRIAPDPTCPDCADPRQVVRLPPTALQRSLAELGAEWDAIAAEGPSRAQCDAMVARYTVLADDEGHVAPAALFNAGVVRDTCDQSTEAAALYGRVLDDESAPTRIRSAAANNLGVMAIDAGHLDEGRRWLERAVEIEPTAPAPRVNFAAALRRAGRADEAFATAEHQLHNALALESADRGAFENLARLYYDRGREDRSYLLLADLVVTQGQRVLKAHGQDSAGLHNIRGLIFVERSDPVSAIRAFNAAVAADPTHAEAHLNRAMIAIRLRDFDTAKASLDVALDDPRWAADGDAWLAMGVARRGLREYADAERAFNTAMQRTEGDPRGLYNLGVLYQEHIAPHSTDFDPKAYRKAQTYFERFEADAGTRTDLAVAVADAKRRHRQIEELFEAVATTRRIQRQVERLEALERKQRAEEKARLLELERRARSQAEGTGPTM